jgi:hypothetical protein
MAAASPPPLHGAVFTKIADGPRRGVADGAVIWLAGVTLEDYLGL